MQEIVSRLITQFKPEHYSLYLTLDRTGRTFDGTMTMSGSLATGAEKISVHAKDLTIKSAVVDGKTAEFTAGKNDELHITQPDLAQGRHIVVIEFSGSITDAMHGLYPCYYEHDGEKKELLATQFESHHAREAFPCIDEPEAKATFDVTLTTESDVTVLGNMPVKTQEQTDGKLVTTFETTPRMSTYLLAWVTGDLHRKTTVTKHGVEVNIWATPAQKPNSLDFALDIATRTIDFFDDYFDTPYPLPKSDHIALPDFTSGAMENWGLVTYREVALLADPATSSISSKHYIATVIAHELSHQWFGNLVTMKWWNNLWLNESFATLMEYIAIDALHPEWNVWLDFATGETPMALRRDCLDGVQPVQLDVHHPDEISTLFDSAIVYAKGARLLRMLQQYIGDEAFQLGLKAYFAKHAYGNTEGDDLWQALGAASGKDITNFMNTWISQPGYPVVSATQDGNTLTLSQERFFVGPHEPSDQLWPVPLNSSSSALPALLEEREVTLERATSAPLRLNVGDSAHFITRYGDDLMAKLIEELETDQLAPLDRLQLLHEQSLLARAGLISSDKLLPLLDAYKHETTEAVWDIMCLTIGELKKFVEQDEASEKKLRYFAGQIARAQFERLGWEPREDESETDTKLRANIIGLMIYSEDPEILAIARELYESNTLEELDPELRPLILGAVVRYSQQPGQLVNTLMETYATTSSSELQLDITHGVASTRDEAIIQQLLEQVQSGKTIRHQDAFRWFVYLLRNRNGRTIAWDWLRNNWLWIEKTFGGDKSYDDFPRYAGNSLTTREQLEQYRQFFTPLQVELALKRVITIGISEIEGKVTLIERDGPAVREALLKL
jgi:aminopeptidase N